MRMESEILQSCIGQEVTIYYAGEGSGVTNSDSGTITESDGLFLRLERRNNTDLIIPVSAIRIINTRMRGGRGEARTLPRPAGALTDPEDSEA